MASSIMDRFFSVLQNNPSVAAGGCTFAIAFALVAGNAFYAQSGAHPDPIWATRDMTTTQSVPDVRPVQTTRIQPKKRPARDSATVARHKKLVSRLQIALAKTGDYEGDVDGLMGPMTRAAITKYQKRNNMHETGKATQELAAFVENRLPKVASQKKADKLSGIIANTEPVLSDDEMLNRALVMRIQEHLARATGSNIDVDGIFGNQTEQALRQFQQRHGLKVTGQPDRTTIEKLVSS
ncbi:peptidoglycan-binding domain-containing protein [Salaquimonas pukyongi]|uniref:peptidoglycan-binding domain-containing protein n=1 Tax=Salaquimonas pukyongi TaxID=2712698 RepID=UPI0013BEA87B|nr:peptidoglycan-binding protein [Salaquimonas pukyongi]